MEFTKEQLRKIIQEEFQISIEEGEIDEGFLDRLFGKDKRSTEFVTGREVKDVVNKVINSISELVRIASRQGDMRLADKAAELKRQAMSLSVQEVQELVVPAVPTTPYTLDWTSGAIHYLTTIPSDLTVDITNLPTTANRNYVVSVYLVQDSTAYYITRLDIAGSTTPILWSGGSAPTPRANSVEIQTFSLYYSGSAWTALSQLSSFG